MLSGSRYVFRHTQTRAWRVARVSPEQHSPERKFDRRDRYSYDRTVCAYVSIIECTSGYIVMKMETNDFSVREAAERIRRKTEIREQERAERRTRAKEWARRTAVHLGHCDRSLQRVFGFGSTFEEWRNYRSDSDIDLGVEGGDWSLLMRSIPPSEFDVSIVELDLQNTEFADYVRAHGEVLYERQ